MNRIVGVGACVLDTVIECSAYPAEDTKLRASGILKRGGGPVGNALAAAAVLGAKAAYLGTLPDNADGDFLADELERYGVRCRAGRVQADAFTSYVILGKDKGSRTCIFEKGTLPDDSSFLNVEELKKADILHLDGNFLQSAVYAAQFAKNNGIRVSLDAGGLYSGIGDLLPLVDILIPSAEFALGWTQEPDVPSAMQKLYAMYRPAVLVVTEGARGGRYLEDGQVRSYPSFSVAVKDSNGAGDVFHGAFLVAYAKKKSVGECCRFASAVAALKCTGVGVKQSIPSLQETEIFLQCN